MHSRLSLLDPDLRRLKLLALAILLLAAVDLGGLLALRRMGGLRVPPVRFWAGPAFLYADDGAASAAGWMGAVYFALVVLLPTALLLLGLLLAACLAARLRLLSRPGRTAHLPRLVTG